MSTLLLLVVGARLRPRAMLDTDHDGESFFARRIHFPGADKDAQIKKLLSRLGRRADDVEAEALTAVRSAPFDPVGAENSVVGFDLQRCQPILIPGVPNLVPIPGIARSAHCAVRPL